ncbi:MAG: AtpZ/AtpI family protein [Ilumatobacteraceae bacterium]
MSQGVELAATVVVFFFIGFGVDAWVGTTPLFIIAFTVFAMIGQSVKMYFSYAAAMTRLELERAEAAKGVQNG